MLVFIAGGAIENDVDAVRQRIRSLGLDDGLIVEVHPCPEQARSDEAQLRDADEFDAMMADLGPLVERLHGPTRHRGRLRFVTHPARALAMPGGLAPLPRLRTFEVGPGALPEAGPLGPADVAVWLARGDAWGTAPLRARWAALASEEERERAARFHFEDDRQTYLAAHGLLRIALALHVGTDPRAWRFVTNPWGRPELASPSRVRFSLSHTRGLVACAVAIDRDVGLDVEDASAQPPLDAAHRFFSPREARALAALPAGERPARFFEYWTLKESFLKATGVGLSRPLDGFSLVLDGPETWRLEGDGIPREDAARWAFRAWRVSPRWQAALAIELAPSARSPGARGT